MFFRYVVMALGVAFLVGCSSTPDPSSPTSQDISSTDEQIFVGDPLEKNYDPHVIMKRAESFFEKENYPEALTEYQHFLDMHRTHVLASYAQYKMGESHLKMATSVDRDPEPITQAIKAFEKLLTTYPGSNYQDKALGKIQDGRRWLAEANFFVGQFYYRREAYLAAAHRFESIVEQYPDLKVAADALFSLALTYKDLGADEWAQEKLILLAERYPNHQHQEEFQTLLAQLNVRNPLLTVSQKSSSSPDGSSFLASGRNATAFSPSPLPAISPNGENGSSPSKGSPVRISRSTSTVPSSTAADRCPIGTWCYGNERDSGSPPKASPVKVTPSTPSLPSTSNGNSCSLGSWC